MDEKDLETRFHSQAMWGSATAMALLEVLVEQGVLTQEQAQDVRKRASAKGEAFLDQLKLMNP